MKLSKTKSKGNILEISFKDEDDWYVNTVRRLVLDDVPIIAVELVEISKNDSILYDEIIAHRLGLIPLTTDSSYELPGEEEMENQEYLAKSSCKLTLSVKGPCVVFAKDMKSSDPKVKPVYPDMPIVKLLEGQELKLVATAVMGLGKQHSKWSAAHAYFKKVEDDFLLHIESWGQLKPVAIVKSAVDQYNKQLKEFDSLVTK